MSLDEKLAEIRQARKDGQDRLDQMATGEVSLAVEEASISFLAYKNSDGVMALSEAFNLTDTIKDPDLNASTLQYCAETYNNFRDRSQKAGLDLG